MRLLYFSRGYTVHDRRFLARGVEAGCTTWFLRLGPHGLSVDDVPLPKGVQEVECPEMNRDVDDLDHIESLVPVLRQVIDRIAPDIIHAGPIQTCGYMASLAGRRPLVLMSWGSDMLVDAARNDRWTAATRTALAGSDMLICDAESVEQRVLEISDYDASCILRFPWGIDLEQFASSGPAVDFRSRHGWEDSKVVISTRSWEAIYGTSVVLAAFQEAHQIRPELRLVLAGTGSELESIQREIRDRKLTGVVTCPGRVPNEELATYFRGADAYLSCAISDGTSISLLEALAIGLPVVVTDLPSNREWVSESCGAWFAPAGDSQGFAAGLLSATTLAPDEIDRVRAQHRQTVECRADWNLNSSMLLDGYRRLLTAPSPS